MELSKIKFRGYDVNGSSLVIHDETKEGRYKVSFGEISISTNSDEDGNWMFVDVTPTVAGFEEDSVDEENPVFEATASLTVSFQCDFEEIVSEEFYKENAWFFENFIYISTKLAIDNILRDTVLGDIGIPWSHPL